MTRRSITVPVTLAILPALRSALLRLSELDFRMYAVSGAAAKVLTKLAK